MAELNEELATAEGRDRVRALIREAHGDNLLLMITLNAFIAAIDRQAQRADRLDAALGKAVDILERTTVLFDAKYLLHTDALLKELKAARE